MKTKNRTGFNKTTLITLLALTFTPVLSQADALEDIPDTEKLVRIRPANTTTTTTSPTQGTVLKVELGTEKSSYIVNESIRFRVRSNKQVFLYLFNIDPRTGKALAILPNRLQTDHEVKYPGDANWRIVPNKNLEFFSDRPGVERIIMVASERYLDISKLKSFGNTKSVGDFFALDNPLDALDVVINDAYNEGASGEKLIRIRSNKPTSPRSPRGLVFKEVRLRIR